LKLNFSSGCPNAQNRKMMMTEGMMCDKDGHMMDKDGKMMDMKMDMKMDKKMDKK